MPKLVTTLPGPIHFSAIGLGKHNSFQRNVATAAAFGNTVSNLTGRDLEPQTPNPETTTLPLDQLAGRFICGVWHCKSNI